jgi:hypothetical protein
MKQSYKEHLVAMTATKDLAATGAALLTLGVLFMRTLADRSEAVLAKIWPFVGLATLALIMMGCAYTQVMPDGTLETVGQDIIPGILPQDGIVQDIAGAVNDAVQDVDVGAVVKTVADRDWLGLIVAVVTAVSAVAGGVVIRQRARDKAAVKLAAEVKTSTVAQAILGGTGGPGGIGGVGGVGGPGGVGGVGGSS